MFLPIYYTEASLILTQADKIGYEPVFFGCDGLDGLVSVENFDTSLAEDVMLMTPFTASATDDKTAAFVKAYNEAYGEDPNQFAADAYDAIYAIHAAVEKAGVTADMDASAICDALKAAFTEITLEGRQRRACQEPACLHHQGRRLHRGIISVTKRPRRLPAFTGSLLSNRHLFGGKQRARPFFVVFNCRAAPGMVYL